MPLSLLVSDMGYGRFWSVIAQNANQQCYTGIGIWGKNPSNLRWVKCSEVGL